MCNREQRTTEDKFGEGIGRWRKEAGLGRSSRRKLYASRQCLVDTSYFRHQGMQRCPRVALGNVSNDCLDLGCNCPAFYEDLLPYRPEVSPHYALSSVGIMSVNERASYMSAPRPRVASNRVAGSRGASPLHDTMDPLRTSTASQKHRLSRDQKSMPEKRTERTVITTRERSVRRNPIKESSSAANRGDRDKS